MYETMSNTPKRKKIRIRYIVLICLLIYVWLTLLIPPLGSLYAKWIYPYVSVILSSFAKLFPFSLNNLFIISAILGFIIYPIYSRHKKNKRSWKKILFQMGTFIVCVYVWFYIAWGLNYAQPDFFHRTPMTKNNIYDRELFTDFLEEYLGGLNNSYTFIEKRNINRIRKEIYKQYFSLNPDEYGIHNLTMLPPKHKQVLFSKLFTKMGISGFMGPFFCEYHINEFIPNSQYASTFAHELSHFLGVANEAEANFYAYIACTNSMSPEVQFSGYLSVLNYVLRDAKKVYTEDQYEQILPGIRPEVKEEAKNNYLFWKENCSPSLSNAQNKIYDLYLKGNKIKSGTDNYSEVMELLISHQQWKREQEELYRIQEGLK